MERDRITDSDFDDAQMRLLLDRQLNRKILGKLFFFFDINSQPILGLNSRLYD